VNLFAPCGDDKNLGKTVLSKLIANLPSLDGSQVAVHFEYTPAGADRWLGERGQGTQIDVAFEVSHSGQSVGFVLIEVKFTEAEFGSCRGYKAPSAKQLEKGSGESNPDRTRCDRLDAIRSNPNDTCWMAQQHGRTYWEWIAKTNSSITLDTLPGAGPCPFRHGLYQLMRNRVLADAMLAEGAVKWVQVGVCRHPQNQAALLLKSEVGGKTNAITAFNRLLRDRPLVQIDPREVVNAIEGADPRWADWAREMRSRYCL
jgi:hypothetical protein